MYTQKQSISVILDERTQYTPAKQIVDNRTLSSVQAKLKQTICQQNNFPKHIPLHENLDDTQFTFPDKTSAHKGETIQCLMSKFESEEKDAVFIKDANELGYENFVKTEYADLLIKDNIAYVKGNSTYKGIAGVKRLLDTAKLKEGTIKKDLLDSVAKEERASELNGGLKDVYEKYLQDEYSLDKDSLDKDKIDIIENYAETDTMRKCMDSYFGTNLDGSQVDEIDIKSLPETWSSDIAQALYLQTYHNFVEAHSHHVLYIQPYIKLISDINAGNITKLSYVNKYTTKDGGFGAEFQVEEPVVKKGQYQNEAVLHTHYISKISQPNFAHTKPYFRKNALGYGHTKVDLSKVIGIDDTRKVYNAL